MVVNSASISQSFWKNQYFVFTVAGLLTFIIPFYPVYVLITDNGQLELAAILVFYQMIATIPVGFIVGILSYRALTRNTARLFSPFIQFLLFALISLTPVTIFGIFSYQITARGAQQLADFKVTAEVTNEKVSSQKTDLGPTHLIYEYDLSLNNESTYTFNSVSADVQLINSDDKSQSNAYSEKFILPQGKKTLHMQTDLSTNVYQDANFTNPTNIKITIRNGENMASRDFTFESKITNWSDINKNLQKSKAALAIPEGYQRFVNYKKGIQMDFPNNWTGAYGAETGAPPDSSEDATNHYFSKYDVGSITLQWDNSLPSNLCIQGVTESNIESMMANEISFLQTYRTLKTQGIKVRACVNDQTNTDEIKRTLKTLKIIKP